jgi:hypothetical protein
MVTPDYQEFANRADTEYRYNTVICGTLARGDAEIARALRDCHAARPARKRNFLPKRGMKVPLAAIFAAASVVNAGG